MPVQLYASTTVASEEEIEIVYTDLENTFKETTSKDITITQDFMRNLEKENTIIA